MAAPPDPLTWRELVRWAAVVGAALFVGGEYRDFKRTMSALDTLVAAQEATRSIDHEQTLQIKETTEAARDHEARVRTLEEQAKRLREDLETLRAKVK